MEPEDPRCAVRGGRVLVVDDDAPVRRALARLLRAAGYEVETLEHAAAYLDHPAVPAPACLLVDVRMPDMSGVELFKRITGTERALPVVFITGHSADELRGDVLASGAVAVLYAPLEEHDLLDAVEQALDRSLRTA